VGPACIAEAREPQSVVPGAPVALANLLKWLQIGLAFLLRNSPGMDVDLQLIRKHLKTPGVSRDIRVLANVTSTNAALRDLAKAGAPEGTAVIADEQTAGRGRLGQPWFSPPGVNLYASVLFRPAIPPREIAGFSFVASVAVADAIEAQGLDATIKWPNDVLINRKKVAGTLVESGMIGDRVDYVILGVGVNVNVTHGALRAALGLSAPAAGSIREAAGHEIDRNVFAAAVLDNLATWAEVYETRGPTALLEAWGDRDILTGRRVEVRGEGATYGGRVLGVDREGHLVLRDSHGQKRQVLSGEVRVAD
jgi:BirA family transcriptional regulator, biotin operon repressor / biotin---[acetyl-CoA-carboxylase] ligase